MGCCGSLLRFILGLINVLFLLIGIALVVCTSILKWANISKFKEISGLDKLINLTSIDAVAITLLCIGGFIILLSFIGLIGITCSNRGFLIVYEIVIVILFMAHLGALIALLVMSSKIETEFRKALNDTIITINNPTTSASELKTKCEIMKGLSNLFTCCGANGPQDFANTANIANCCQDASVKNGCADTSVDAIKKYSIYLLVIPTSVILFIELISIISVPFLIGQISNNMKNS